MRERIVDLHSHTNHSDGSDTPTSVVVMAHARGASAIAVTDHDTVSGLSEARVAAEQAGIEFVNGIEISADYSPGTMHILGYYIDDHSRALASKLEELKLARKRRNPEIADRLQSLGLEISYDEVASLAGNEVVGRPHFARLMVQRNYAVSIQDAFDRFLAKGAPAYVEKKRLAPAEAIALIHDAGGVAVLAHPYQLKLSLLQEAEVLIGNLAALGLDGIEALYSRHSPEERQAYAAIATRHGLIVTGGSDYHGTYKPDLDLVIGKGDLRVPYSALEEVKAKAKARAEQNRRIPSA